MLNQDKDKIDRVNKSETALQNLHMKKRPMETRLCENGPPSAAQAAEVAGSSPPGWCWGLKGNMFGDIEKVLIV